MPCWTIQRNSIEWDHVDPKVLLDALKREKANIRNENLDYLTWYDTQGTGVLFTLSGKNLTARYLDKETQLKAMNAQKQLYSRHVVRSQAERFGWKVQDMGNNKFQIQRRG